MESTDYEDAHTSELKLSQEEAERTVRLLKNRGWEVYPEKVPLQGQWGFYCVCTYQAEDGECYKKSHSVRWNLYEGPLRPFTIDCQNDGDLLSFVWQHAAHDGFDYFEYGDGDVGFVCYCRGSDTGCSLVLRVGSEIEEVLSEEAFELLFFYENQE